MIKTPTDLQDLRRKIYLKAKVNKSWRFWGLYIHVCNHEILQDAYSAAKRNNGAPGIDGVTFAQVEAQGVVEFLEKIREELISETYKPQRNRKVSIPKSNGSTRILSIPTIRDRVVQGALKFVLEPVFEADFQDGSYGYRPKRTAHQAVHRVASAAVLNKTRIIDVDLKSYFNTVRHDILLQKVAARVKDDKILRILKLILKASGKRGVPQGGPLSPLASNIYLTEVDKMLEKAKQVTRKGRFTRIEYARWADDIIILVDGFRRWDWLYNALFIRLKEELQKLGVSLNQEKTKLLNMENGETFCFLGFEFRRGRTKAGKWGVGYSPHLQMRIRLLQKLKPIFRRFRSQPISKVIAIINPILRGWVNYFRIGQSGKRFNFVRNWVEQRIRRHLMRQRGMPGFGWARWSQNFIYRDLGLYSDYSIRYLR